jgi:N-acetylmuramoyl-L-alanine amidase
MPALIRHPSSNFNERDKAAPLRYVVLHYTGMPTGKAALDRLCDPKSEVSAHYMIEEDGRIFQLVDETKRAWHAGKSFWGGVRDMNSATIGIEIVNPGHEFGYRAFPETQIAALMDLLRDIIKRNNLNAFDALLAHSDIAPGRKEDPGELFPWEKLAKAGLGLWPSPQSGDYAPARDAVPALLGAIGYDCSMLQDALLAFQRHYEPNNLTGTPEKETVARLRALLRMRQEKSK